ncbi:unnamed protein product [Adineta steineri]|uniref:Death domain-containing protein n=1 Tax=Adineta steineri TaxID=433720 RepID=A0A813RE14_9BILA|nr:unnamed protein product [Adineta steineri]
MGAALNNIPVEKIDELGNITPNRAEWLTSHADASDLSAVEVERLWNRFRHLTGSNNKATLQPDTDALPEELGNDVFVKNLLNHFPRLKTDDSAISFGYFISVMKWFDEVKLHRKLEAIFLYLNNGDPINAVFLAKLLKHMYPNKNSTQVKELSEEIMRDLGTVETGRLNQQEFVDGVLKFIPREELEDILEFHIIPPDILEEIDKLPGLPLPPISTHDHDTADDVGINLVNDDQTKQIAVQLAKKNWRKLALALGFLEYDIEAYKVQNKYNDAATIYELLELWRDQESTMATTTRLKEYLRQCGFETVTKVLK